MRPDIDLVVSCVTAAFRKDHAVVPSGAVDWDRFPGLCEWHNVTPIVCRSLSDIQDAAVPPAVMNRMHAMHRNHTARSLFLTSELSRILRAFKSSGIPAYPFKGPALSVMIYGDPAQRQSKDLDILIPGEALRGATKVLASLEYDGGRDWEGPRLAAHRRNECEASFVRRDRKVEVELQWAVVPGYFGFDYERLGVWSRLEKRAWGGMDFPSIPPEETLVLLCVHGAKHRWCKLGWICDVSGLLELPTRPDLLRTLELAGRCGVTRLLLLGLLLAQRLAGAELPREITDRIEADLMVAVLARQALAVIAKTPMNPDVDPARYLFYLKAKDCRRDQLLFAGRLMATLAAGEWNPSALPDTLSPLYYLFRPLHMAGRHGEPILRAMARK